MQAANKQLEAMMSQFFEGWRLDATGKPVLHQHHGSRTLTAHGLCFLRIETFESPEALARGDYQDLQMTLTPQAAEALGLMLLKTAELARQQVH
ncbi:hypothetical protein [Sphingomonas hengshuiensis]|uniref:hypothetical protein n=1 Tax=Sphingomonas hengshuiensis TaxID=1609977 RepID=UPI000695C15C|nr:hypothetical protein [Sphingomonas hengshuiensis]